MNRTRTRSFSQAQDDAVANIKSHLDFVKRVLKWSISNLDRFIVLLRARIAAEEAYILSLSKLTRTTEPTETTPLFGEKQPSFLCATFYYEQSIEHTIQQRKDLIQGIRAEVEKLVVVKEAQEGRRKMVKQVQGDINANYTIYRTGELVKLKKIYSKKCNDLQIAQQQFEQQQQQQQLQLQQQQQQQQIQQQQQQMQQQQQYDDTNLINDYLPPQHSHRRVSFDESNNNNNRRLSSDSLGDNDSSSIHSLSQQDNSTYKKGMANFMASVAQVRTQFANVAQSSGGPPDLNKQNTKNAKFKKEIMDADHEYRNGIRQLERLRKQQINGAIQTMKHLEMAIINKAEVTQSSLCGILNKEHHALANEIKTNELCQRYAIEINAEKDSAAFNNQYKKLPFRAPEPLRYENYYLGQCKYILFGGSLTEYHLEHDRTVPLLVKKCVEAVDTMGLHKEGIYRVSGRQSNIENLKHAFEQDEEMEIDRKYDVFTIATVLKIYLRQLEEPLLKIDMPTRVKYTELKDKQRQLMYLQTILSGLSRPHRDTLLTIIRHLANVNANSQTNKMNLQNLSVIFTPAIFHDFNQAEHPGEWHADTVFEDLITYYDALFANAEIQSRAKAGPQPPITIKTTPSDYAPPPPSATATSAAPHLLLTAPMGAPPPHMIMANDTPTTPTGNRSASLAALTRSGSLRPSRSHSGSTAQVPTHTNDHQQQQQQAPPDTPTYQYHQQQQQQQHYPYQQNKPLDHASVAHPSSAINNYPPPKLQMHHLTIQTDSSRWHPGGNSDDDDDAPRSSPASGGGGGVSSGNKYVPPRQDSLRTMKHGGSGGGSSPIGMTPSNNSSTSSLAAAVNAVPSPSSDHHGYSSSRGAAPPPHHHMAQPVVIAAPHHPVPSTAQIVPNYSSPVTPGPFDAAR
ncbi:unnamed protein product [Absidia cylindrospora]